MSWSAVAELVIVVTVNDAEVVILEVRQSVPLSQQAADLLTSDMKWHTGNRRGEHGLRDFVARDQSLKHLPGKDDDVVVVTPLAAGALRGHHADDLKGHSVDADGLSDGINAAE